MKTEKEKMLTGELYDATEGHLSAERRRARDLCKALNESRDEEQELRARIIRELFGSTGDGVWIEPPFVNWTTGDLVIEDAKQMASRDHENFHPASFGACSNHQANARLPKEATGLTRFKSVVRLDLT